METVTKQETEVLDSLGLLLAVLSRWVGRLNQANRELDRTAIYDEEDTGEPLNSEAKLQASVAVLLDDYLNPALGRIRDLTKECDSQEHPESDQIPPPLFPA